MKYGSDNSTGGCPSVYLNATKLLGRSYQESLSDNSEILYIKGMISNLFIRYIKIKLLTYPMLWLWNQSLNQKFYLLSIVSSISKEKFNLGEIRHCKTKVVGQAE